MHSILLRFCLAILLAWPLLQDLHAETTTPEEITVAGLRTQERLATDSASWTTTVELPNDYFGEVDTAMTPTMRKYAIRLRRGEARLELAQIIERDGFWYVSTNDEHAKYWPYEAPLSLPIGYILLASSDVLTVAKTPEEFKRPMSVAGKVATYHLPLPESQSNSLENGLRWFREMKPQVDAAKRAQLEEKIKQFEAAIANGAELKIDIESGVIVEIGAHGKRIWTKDFQWLDDANDALFNVADRQWIDRTEPLAAPDSRQDLIMIANQPLWKPNTPAGDMTPLLLNIRTQESRRIPYQEGDAMGGCFSHDRSRVYIAGHRPENSAIGIVEIDLATGENRLLADPELQTGQTVQVALSPDGQKLAAVKKVEDSGQPLEFQIYILDLQTGAARPLGEPTDLAFPSWLPDGDGLILVTREFLSLDKPSISTICRMDMNGEITPLRKGSHPIVLTTRSRILYEDQESDLWYTCDLQGQDPQLVGAGLKGYGFATVSPDNNQMIMMKFGGENGPRPHLVDLDTGKATPIPVGPGLWANPAWQ